MVDDAAKKLKDIRNNVVVVQDGLSEKVVSYEMPREDFIWLAERAEMAIPQSAESNKQKESSSDFVVFERDDLYAVCSEKQLVALDVIGLMIKQKRKEEGRNDNPFYYIVNTDEPYADEIKTVIDKHEKKHRDKSGGGEQQ